MKERVEKSKPVQWFFGLGISRYLANHRLFGKFWNYEILAYIVVGVCTTAVNYVVYFLLPFGDGKWEVVLKTVISWLFAVLFAYLANKLFVFDSPSWSRKIVTKEVVSFFAARLLSLLFDALFMFVTVGVLRLNEPLFKILSGIFVLTANYFFSKYIVFQKSEDSPC